MDIRIRKNSGGIHLMELSGALDLYSSNQLKEILIKMIENKVERFIISLSDIKTINSEGVGALIYASSTLKKFNYPLVIIAPEGPAMKALEATRVKNFFSIAPALKEAIALIAENSN